MASVGTQWNPADWLPIFTEGGDLHVSVQVGGGVTLFDLLLTDGGWAVFEGNDVVAEAVSMEERVAMLIAMPAETIAA